MPFLILTPEHGIRIPRPKSLETLKRIGLV
jgi:hypothetical protein